MKVIIPVAGVGTQLRPLTYTQPKPLIPVAGKAILSHILDSLIEEGLNDFIFVTGYMGEKIQIFLDDNYDGINKEYAFQKSREGLGHAIWLASDFFKDESEVLVVLGDTIVDLDLKAFMGRSGSVVGVHKVDDPRKFGVVEVDADNRIKRVVEKPKIPKSNLGIAGIYKIQSGQDLHEALDNLISRDFKTHGEYQLTDALQWMLEQESPMSIMEVDSWYDCGRKDVLLSTNAIKLQDCHQDALGLYPDSIIVPPVSIAEGCEIHHSIIGPNVSIGPNSYISGSLVRNSIIGSYSRLRDVSLEASVIGQDVSLTGLQQSLNIGDNTEIDFSSGG